MRIPRSRLVLAGLAGTLILGGAVAPSASAAQAPPASVEVRGSRFLDVSVSPGGLTAPATTTPGTVIFRASTTDPGAGLIGLTRLASGVTWERFRDIQRRTLSDDPAVVVQAQTELAASADLLGGVVTHPGLSGSFSQDLTPGTYLLFEYFDLENAPAPRYRWLTVSGAASGTHPTPTATLVSESVAGAPRFTLSGTVRAGRPWKFVNKLPQENEAVFFPLAADVSESDLTSYFDKFGPNGEWPADPPPFDQSKGVGSLPLNPGRSSVIQIPLTVGRYVALTWLKDATDGRTRLVKEGQYKIVEVR
ncbi:hypothetical protein ACIBBB_03005 [Streptomyces sp. NPDC051217]|uniref:hypothetical protein n=1 Tax=Streptomyces sp. NPDC051217 TaxID=3365644 RepID=UPI0037B6EC33